MRITRGRVLAQRFYDIADEIDLQRAAELVQTLSRRPRFVRSARQIRLPNPPLEMALAARPSPLSDVPVVEILVRLYDVGAIAVTFVLEPPGPMDAEDLIRLSSRLLGGEDLFIERGRAIADEIAAAIRGASRTRSISEVTEEYTIFHLLETEPRTDSDSLPDQLDVQRLLLGETGPISRRERAQQAPAYISYGPDELVAVDWNSALVYDPSGSTDLSDLLELTSMQLLELRAYDDLVARSLAKVYDELGYIATLFRSTKYARLARQTMRIYVDVSEMTDRIENSLTTLGDSWLARVHRSAVEAFEMPHWQRTLNEKIEVLRQINELLVNQLTSTKTYRVEFAIVLLIVLEIVLALLELA